jgi:uncharacterized protein (DUF1015 family)
MADIRPFKGTRYNKGLVPDLAKVICPPYDIISPQQQDELYKNSEYNFIRIEFNKETTQDTPKDNRYTRAAANIENWLKKGVLKTDNEPAFYVHEHLFTCLGKKYSRQNILALAKLEEWDTKTIRPHENIIPKAKSDRMSMLAACQSNTSTVLSMYSDPKKTIAKLLKIQEKNPPDIDVVDSIGERHMVWAVSDPKAVSQIQQVIASQPLYIADGHHRYDSALTYRRERIAKTTSVSGDEGFNFVMMNLFDFADPGLVILPTHRLLKGISSEVVAGLKANLKTFFDIEELSMDSPDVWDKLDTLFSNQPPGTEKVKLAVYGLEADKLLVLTLKSLKAVEQYMPSGHSEAYKKLDVSLVDHIILEKLIGFVKDSEKMTIAYSHDRVETINQVKDKQYQLAFILGPVDPNSIKVIADLGDRMPRKSTYFYPKAPAGLVFFRW